MVPGVGDEAAAADSHGLAVVSISIGATSEGFVWSFIDVQAKSIDNYIQVHGGKYILNLKVYSKTAWSNSQGLN